MEHVRIETCLDVGIFPANVENLPLRDNVLQLGGGRSHIAFDKNGLHHRYKQA